MTYETGGAKPQTAQIHSGEFVIPFRYWLKLIIENALNDGSLEAMRRALEKIRGKLEDKP